MVAYFPQNAKGSQKVKLAWFKPHASKVKKSIYLQLKAKIFSYFFRFCSASFRINTIE